MKGGTCHKNIADLMTFINTAKVDMQKQIDQKIPTNRRLRTYIVFVDLKKAFDTVDRALLVETMDANGFDSTVINAYSTFCDKMTLEMKDGS